MKKSTTKNQRGRTTECVRKNLALALGFMLLMLAGFTPSALAQKGNSNSGTVVECKKALSTDGRQVELTVSGQLPAQATVNATAVQRTAVQGKQVKGAYDITIKNGNAKWQPQTGKPVTVTISDPNFTDGEMMDVYHEGDNGNEFVATVTAHNGAISFPAKSFSVYIVTESGAGARLKVNFHQADSNVVSIYVKAADATDEETYKTVLYDPGVGTLPTGVQFRGWTTNPDYTVAQADDGMTIGQVRTMVEPLLADVSDGDSLVLYPMLFKLYRLTYFDEEGAVLKSQEVLFLVNSDQNYHACTVNEAYTPSSSEQNFLGWRVTEGDNNIQGYTEGTLYQNETTIYIKGNVKLRAHVPYGHWLVFNENGKGASFTAAQFVENGQNTVEPIEPTRVGYQFGGWYTDAACTDGNEFTFNSTITDHVTVYAKWTLNPAAGYTVIIWKQNVSGTSYDFGASITNLTGTPNTTINTVSQQGTGNSSYAQVGGTSYEYSGFHLDHFDQNVTISPEGNSVLNVYYNRNQHTLTFQIQQGNTWTTIKTITALYEQSIGANFPIVGDNGTVYNNGERWSPQTNSLGYNQVMVYLDIMPAGDVTFRLNTANRPLKTMNYYVEALPGETGTTITAPNTLYNYNNTSITAPSGKRYVLYNSISARYNGVTVEDFIELLGYERLGANSQRTNQSGTSYWIWSTSQDGTVNFFYTRKVYSINFMDGVYMTGDGAPITEEPNHGQWTHVDNIAYGADISSYNNNGDDYYVPTKDGYAFEGWYIDDACTQPYTFDNMIEGGITVYAKWRQIQYRVFLHPNAVDPETGANDQSFDWPAGQKFNFRVDFGEKVATPTANRDDYKFVGWYTDSTFNHVFNGDMIVLNDQTVTTPYDKTVDMTDDVDAWGNIIPQGAYNSDITGNDGGDRFWITRKLDLYARWRSILEGAKGINIRYVYIDPEEHTNIVLVQTEEDIFNDDVTAFSIPAPAPDAVLPEGGRLPSAQDSVFFKWVIQHWSAEDGDFIDSDVSVYPGSPFSVSKNDALKEDNPGYATDPTQDQYIYTIQVRAEYIPVEKYSSTFIVWYYNYENANPDTVRQDGKLNVSDPHANLDINKAVSIPVPTRPGYLFKGWYKANIEDMDDVESTYTIPDNTPNFLFYNNEDEKFYANYNANTGTYSNPADSVAADEDNPYDYLYAVWEANSYTVHFDDNGANATETMDDQLFEFDQEQALTTNTFTYEDHCFQGWATSDNSTTVAYTDGQTVSNLTDVPGAVVNLYAVWAEVPTVSVQNVTVCQGAATTMTAVLTNTQLTGVTYQWYTVSGETATAVEGATAATYAPTASGSYKVVVTNKGCTANATATLTINPLPTVDLTVPTDAQVLCPNKDTYPVSAEATGGTAPYSYAWTGATPTTENGPEANVVQVEENNCTEEGYQYQVSVVATDDNGCASAAAQGSFTVQMAPGDFIINDEDAVDNVTVDCPALADVLPTEYLPIVKDACDNTLEPVLTEVSDFPECGGEGATVTYTYTYTDCAGNTADWVFTYNISAPANPTLTLQTDPVTATPAGECKYKIPAVQYTAAAACNGTLTVTQKPAIDSLVEQTAEAQLITITVTATDNCGKSTSKTTTVTIPAKPTVTITPSSTTTCYGSSVQLDATAGFESYSWSYNQLTSASITAENLTETTTFTVQATDANGCVATDSKQVTVAEIGNVTITGTDEVCMNGDATLNAPEGTDYTYLWTTGDNTQSITVAKMTQGASFGVTVTDANGCISEGEIEVTVNPLPTVTVDNVEVCADADAVLEAEGTENVSYQWYNGETIITDATNATYTAEEEGNYKVVVTDANGCTAEATASVTIYALPDVGINNEFDAVCYGGTAILTATGAESYVWSTGDEDQMITIENVTQDLELTVTGTDANNCSKTATAEVTVNPLPEIVDLTVPTDELLLCPNKGTYQVSASATGGAEPYTYTWTGAEPTTTGGPVANVEQLDGENNCTPNGTEYNVSVVVTDANGCASATADGSFTVQMANGGITFSYEQEAPQEVDCVDDIETPTLPTATDACGNELTPTEELPTPGGTFNGCSGTKTYTYTYEDCAGNTANWVYTYTVKEPANPTLTLQAAEAIAASDCKYEIPQVEFSAAISCGGEIDSWTQTPEAGTYVNQTDAEQTIEITVSVTDDCGKSATETTTVTIPAKPTVEITANQTQVCNGGSVTLTASEGFESYSWSYNQLTSASITAENLHNNTTFTVNATDANGCTAEDSQEVTVAEMGEVTITGDNEVCMNGSVTLTAPESETYFWTNGAESQSITLKKVTQNATFGVTVTDANGCQSEGEIEITVLPLTTITATGNVEQTITYGDAITDVTVSCENGTLSYTGTVSGLTITPNDATAPTQYTVSGTPTAVTESDGITLTFIATNPNNCGDETQDVVITVNPRPITITANNANNVYTGSSITYATASDATSPYYEITSGSLLDGQSVTAITLTGEGTDANTYPIDITSVTIGDYTDNYDITLQSGTLTITPVTNLVTVTITENSDEVDYDGNEHTITGYASMVADNDLYNVTSSVTETPTDAWTVTETNAGTYDMGIVAGDFANTNNNFTNVEFVIVDGQLKINKSNALGLAAINYSGKYDGVTHTGGGTVYGVPAGTPVTLTYFTEASGWSSDAPSLTDVGLVNYLVKATSPNYEDAEATGFIAIQPRDLTITAIDQTYPYTGYPQGPGDMVYSTQEEIAAVVTVSDDLQGYDHVASITLDGQATDIGTHENVLEPSAAVIKNGSGAEVTGTGNYNIIYVNGNITITGKKTVAIHAHESKVYDGTVLEATVAEGKVTATGLDEGDVLVSGTLTTDDNAVGTYLCHAGDFNYTAALEVLPSDFSIVDAEGNDVMGKYQPDFSDVELIITPLDCQGVEYQDHYYPAVQIGTQCWLAENLRYTGTEENPVAEYAAYNDDDSFVEDFGYLYTWYSAVGVEENNDEAVPETLEGTGLVQGICPEGWVVPSHEDFVILRDYTAGQVRRLRDMDPQYWFPGTGGIEPNYHFNARAGGFYNSVTGQYERMYLDDYYWESTSDPNTTVITMVDNNYACNDLQFKNAKRSDKRSIRCISVGTAYNEIEPEPEPEPEFKCGTSNITIGENSYETVQIGEQCWTKTNMREIVGENATSSHATSIDDPLYYKVPLKDVTLYGYLYNWKAATMVCPDGWHLPSHLEWIAMEQEHTTEDVSSTDPDAYGHYAGNMATSADWSETSDDTKPAAPGYTGVYNDRNALGFSAIPAGYHSNGFLLSNQNANFWTSTPNENDSEKAYGRYLYYSAEYVGRYTYSKTLGFSVRCVKNAENTLD